MNTGHDGSLTTALLALGAPAELVRASIRAGLDERDHARRCFSLAACYADAPQQPGALDVHDSLAALDVVEIARSLASEGCVAETVSLMLLSHARDRAQDPAVRACLQQMVIEEQRHVLLAWQALSWMCARFGAPVLGAVAQVFATAEQHVGFGARSAIAGDAELMRAHGYLSLDARRELSIAALRELVLPAAAALLGATRRDSARPEPAPDPILS